MCRFRRIFSLEMMVTGLCGVYSRTPLGLQSPSDWQHPSVWTVSGAELLSHPALSAPDGGAGHGRAAPRARRAVKALQSSSVQQEVVRTGMFRAFIGAVLLVVNVNVVHPVSKYDILVV